jgi:hypothetical protein
MRVHLFLIETQRYEEKLKMHSDYMQKEGEKLVRLVFCVFFCIKLKNYLYIYTRKLKPPLLGVEVAYI